MLEKAHERIARKGVRNVRLLQMDAQNMKFADDSFDIVYAPYVISVVPDPVAVTREMHRVCRPGGKIIILNHFRSKSRLGSWLEKIIAPFTLYLGFKSDLDLPAFLVQAEPEAGVDREGEHPADLVARHLHQGLTRAMLCNQEVA